ncbi:MAG TPA: hypothetical protein ENF78_05015, partial [Candidatus Bathyarchaeota archaeon]|nr:hypothetical protein [Candidatus Bathyarchaeota archaeon]
MAGLERKLGLALTAIGLAIAILTIIYVALFCVDKAIASLKVPESLDVMASRWTPTLTLTAMMIALSSALMKVGTDLIRQWLASRPPEEAQAPSLVPSRGLERPAPP